MGRESGMIASGESSSISRVVGGGVRFGFVGFEGGGREEVRRGGARGGGWVEGGDGIVGLVWFGHW
jgi:hypothetical protein